MIQDRIFNYNDAGRVVPEDFGMQINSKNIDLYQFEQKNKQIQYMLAHQEDIQELSGKVNSEKKKIKEFDCGEVDARKS